MDERITAVASIESPLDGSVVIVVRPVDLPCPEVARAAFTITLWRDDSREVRMSLCNPATGAIAYLQSGATLIAFARDLGFDVDS